MSASQWQLGAHSVRNHLRHLSIGHVHLLALLHALFSDDHAKINSVVRHSKDRKVPRLLLHRIGQQRLCWDPEGNVTTQDLTQSMPAALVSLLASPAACDQAVIGLDSLVKLVTDPSGTDVYTVDSAINNEISCTLTRLAQQFADYADIDTRYSKNASKFVLYAFPLESCLDLE